MHRRGGGARDTGRLRRLPAFAVIGARLARGRAYLALLGASPLRPLRLVRDDLLAERERWILWLPVLAGAGAGLYYALPFEPPTGWPVPVGLLLAACRLIAGGPARGRSAPSRHRQGAPSAAWASALFGILAPVALGFAVAHWQTLRTATVALPRPIPAVAIVGTVERVEEGERSLRLVLRRPASAPPLAGVRLHRLRIVVRTAFPVVRPGDRLRVFARLEPPRRPALPHGFDPARREWLRGIGALGYALAPPRVLSGGRRPAFSIAVLSDRWRGFVGEWRADIARRIRRVLPGADGGLAIALLTGQRGWLARETVRGMRDAGLAHLLAISGLHLGLVAGLVFAAVRLVLALFPAVALAIDVRRPAAVAALFAAAGYLVLSGANVATERAFLMTGIALVAVIVGRDPFSMRLVAFAALVLLLARPSDLLEPGFQMSFAAVVALIGVYEAWSDRSRTTARRVPFGLRERAGRYLLGVLATTLIAEAAIAPFAVFHFHVVARYGLPANLVAVPVTAFWVMPSGVLALAAMPFGLEEWPLRAMAWGLTLVRETAAEVAALDGARWVLPAFPVSALALIALAGCWAMIWRSLRLRALALAPLLLAVAIIHAAPLPDVLVDERGRLIAVRDGDTLFASDLRAARGSRSRWRRALGLVRSARWDRPPRTGDPGRMPPLVCGRPGCLVEIATRPAVRRFLLMRRKAAVGGAGRCPETDVLIVPPGAVGDAACRPSLIRIDGWRLRRQGAHAFFVDRTTGDVRIETVEAARGRRPWSTEYRSRSSAGRDGAPLSHRRSFR